MNKRCNFSILHITRIFKSYPKMFFVIKSRFNRKTHIIFNFDFRHLVFAQIWRIFVNTHSNPMSQTMIKNKTFNFIFELDYQYCNRQIVHQMMVYNYTHSKTFSKQSYKLFFVSLTVYLLQKLS